MEEAQARYDELKTRYGSAYMRDYGWAAAALGRKPDGKPPTFVDLEASLDLRVSRPAYRSASEAIHAGTGALVDNPSKSVGRTAQFLTRGSEFGLLDPGARTAGTLTLLSRALMTWRPYPNDLVALVSLDLMVRDTVAAFAECDRRIMEAVTAG